MSLNLFIPKMLRRFSDGLCLTLSETLCEPCSYCHSRRHLADHEGVNIEDNSPEMIRAAVEEMLARLDGELKLSTEVQDLRARASGFTYHMGPSEWASSQQGFPSAPRQLGHVTTGRDLGHAPQFDALG